MKISELKAIIHLLPEDTEVSIGEASVLPTAVWEYWAGWSGNHDRRLEDATCSNCGFKHATVYDNKDLAPNCPGCRSKMQK